MSDKADITAKKMTRDIKGCYIIMKESVHSEDIIILHVYVPRQEAKGYIVTRTEQKLEVDPHKYDKCLNTKYMEHLNIHMQENESQSKSHLLHKVNSKWITDLNVKCTLIKL